MRFIFLIRRMAYNVIIKLLKPLEHLQDVLHMTRASMTHHGFGIMSWDIYWLSCAEISYQLSGDINRNIRKSSVLIFLK